MIKEKKILFPLIFLSWKIVSDSLNKLGGSAALIPGQFLYSVGLFEMWMSLQNFMLLFWWIKLLQLCGGGFGCLLQSRVKGHECLHSSS